MKKNYCVMVSVLHMDEYYSVDKWPTEGDKVEIKFQGNRPGGRVANTACVMATLGNEIHFFDVLGGNSSDLYLLKDLNSYGINTDNVSFIEGIVNSKCLNILSKSEKTCLKVVNAKPQVNLNYDQKSLFLNARYVYCALGSHELMVNSKEVFTSFINHGVRLALDIEEGFEDEEMQYYLGISDILFFNHFGFEKNCAIAKSEEAFLKNLFQKGVKIIAVTEGKKGCRIITQEKDFCENAYNISVVDPSGAGDTFNGAFLHGLMHNWSIERCAKFAIAASNYCVSTYGPRSGAISEKEVIDFMNLHT